MSLIINANNSQGQKFNNDFLIFYRDFRNYLFLPNGGNISINGSSNPSSLKKEFDVNGTPVNIGCQKVSIDAKGSESFTLTLSSPAHNFGGYGTQNSYQNEELGSIRLGDLSQFVGGEVLSELLRKFPSVTLKFSNTGNSKMIDPNVSLTFKPGLLHTDGTITYIGTIDSSFIKSGNYNSITSDLSNLFKRRTFNNVTARAGDRFILDISAKINSIKYYSGYSSPQAYQSRIEILFDSDLPFLQWNI